jgi:hypothetical protein
MSPAVAWLLTAGVVWPAAALALNWGRLAGHRRRAVALLTSLAGITALVVALSAHGQRETLTTGQFLLGGGYVTGHASASGSLRYYVATPVCLLLGTAAVGVPDRAAPAGTGSARPSASASPSRGCASRSRRWRRR